MTIHPGFPKSSIGLALVPREPPLTSFFPLNFRRRLKGSLQATPLGKCFAPSDSPGSASFFRWSKLLSAPSSPRKLYLKVYRSIGNFDEKVNRSNFLSPSMETRSCDYMDLEIKIRLTNLLNYF